MKHLLRGLCSALVLGATAGTATPAAAQGPAAQGPAAQGMVQTAPQATQQLKARCSQLLAYYDRYGGRNPHFDGRRNGTRMDAEVDCTRGFYAEGISTMEAL